MRAIPGMLLLALLVSVTSAAAPPLPKACVTCAEDSEFRDILITVQEGPTGSLMFGVGCNSDSGLTGSIVINERNFDVKSVPVSLGNFGDSGTAGTTSVDVAACRVSASVGVRIAVPTLGPIPNADGDWHNEQMFNFFMGFSR